MSDQRETSDAQNHASKNAPRDAPKNEPLLADGSIASVTPTDIASSARSRPMRVLRRVRVFLSVYYAYMLEYRAEILLWALSNILPLIMMGLWIEVSKGGSYGFTALDFARYFMAVFVIRQFTVVWVIWEFEFHVVEGKLSPFLLQPIDPAWRFLAGHVAERFTRLPFSVGFIVLFFLIYPDAFWVPNGLDALLAIFFVTGSFLTRFLMQYTFAMLAFWVERASAVEQIWWIPYLFLAGLVAPLDVYPQAVRDIALLTPFPYLLYYPAKVLVHGYASAGVSVLHAVAILLGWAMAFFGINRWLWRRGLKHYSAMGA